MSRASFWLILALLGLTVGAAIPGLPDLGDTPVYDAAALISPENSETIHALQVTAFDDADVMIAVVTISDIGRYNEGIRGIKKFAGRWFAKWRIGKGENGRGILFLVSRNDRRVRIELGRDWGSKWDTHCQRILDQHVLPKFKGDRYSAGITAGVRELAAMALAGRSPVHSLPVA